MVRTPEARDRFRIAATLFAAFLVVAGLTCFLTHRFIKSKVIEDRKESLLAIARLMSQNVDGDAHSKLRDPEQMDSGLYLDQVSKLERALREVPSLQFVYTLRKHDGGWVFVLDPTPPGDEDGDGVDDKSYLMDEYPEMPEQAIRAWESQAATVNEDFASDRWGTWLSAYAPVRDSSGRIEAIVGVDQDAQDVRAYIQQLGALIWGCFWVSVVVGGIFSLSFSRVLIRQNRTPNGGIRKIAPMRFLVLQIVLIGMVAGTVVAGSYGYILSNHESERTRMLELEMRKLSDVQGAMLSLAAQSEFDPDLLAYIESSTASARLHWNTDLFQEISKLGEKGDPLWRAKLSPLVAQLASEQAALTRAQDGLAESAEERRGHLMIVLSIATLLSLCSLILVRIAAVQQNRLVSTISESNRLRESYQHVVENLPVGLFQFSEGEVAFANWSFDAQTGRTQGDSFHSAFFKALHPDDRIVIADLLKECADQERAFNCPMRLVSPNGETQYYECRGVPVFGPSGEFLHLLCFNVNITDLRLANESLKTANDDLNAANVRLRRAMDDLERNFVQMVYALVKAVDAKDPYTAGHSERVMKYAVRIGQEAGLSQEDLRILEMGTLIHDLGKIGIPDDVLRKPDKLTNDEFELIKKHVTIGYDMIQGVPLFEKCVPIVRWHHERLDGRGYPDGISGDAIPTLVRIAAVADSFDAMTSTRAYRKGMPVEVALAELRKDAENNRLDAKFVELLANTIERDGIIDHLDDEPLAA